MVRVKLAYGKFSVWVYSEINAAHKLPHCHIHWSDGASVVALPTLEVIAGPRLPREARTLLEVHLEDICQAWDERNPERTVE